MRDFRHPHPTIPMDGDKSCLTCQHAKNLGWCTIHQADVSAFDGCSKHLEVANKDVTLRIGTDLPKQIEGFQLGPSGPTFAQVEERVDRSKQELFRYLIGCPDPKDGD